MLQQKVYGYVNEEQSFLKRVQISIYLKQKCLHSNNNDDTHINEYIFM